MSGLLARLGAVLLLVGPSSLALGDEPTPLESGLTIAIDGSEKTLTLA